MHTLGRRVIDAHMHLYDNQENRYEHMEHPDATFEALVGDYSTLPKRYLEIAIVVVSKLNECHYCVAHHKPFLAVEGTYRFRFACPPDKVAIWINHHDAEGFINLLGLPAAVRSRLMVKQYETMARTV